MKNCIFKIVDIVTEFSNGEIDLVLIQDTTSAYRIRWWAKFGGNRTEALGEKNGWSCAATAQQAITWAAEKMAKEHPRFFDDETLKIITGESCLDYEKEWME